MGAGLLFLEEGNFATGDSAGVCWALVPLLPFFALFALAGALRFPPEGKYLPARVSGRVTGIGGRLSIAGRRFLAI